MVEMCVRQKDVTDRVDFFERKVAYTGAGIDQDIMVDQHRRCARAGAYAPTATQYSYTHDGGVLLTFTLWDDPCSKTLG